MEGLEERSERATIPTLCFTKKKNQKKTPNQQTKKTSNKQTNKQIPTITTKTTKKTYLKITLHNNLVTKISSTITARQNLLIDLEKSKKKPLAVSIYMLKESTRW